MVVAIKPPTSSIVSVSREPSGNFLLASRTSIPELGGGMVKSGG